MLMIDTRLKQTKNASSAAGEQKVLSGVVDTDGTTVSVYFAHKTMAEETDNCLEDLLPAKVMSKSELDTESDVIALAP